MGNIFGRLTNRARQNQKSGPAKKSLVQPREVESVTETTDLREQLKQNIRLYHRSLEAFNKFRDCCSLAQATTSLSGLPDLLQNLKLKLDLEEIRLVLQSDEYARFVPSSIQTISKDMIDSSIANLGLKSGKKSVLGRARDMAAKQIYFQDVILNCLESHSAGSVIIFPLQDKYVPEKAIGMLLFFDSDEQRFSGEIATDFVDHFADILAWTIVSLREHEKLVLENTLDHLTGSFNRTYLMRHAPRILEFAQREKFPVSLLFIDLDGFKSVNDSLGHHCGDLVLIETARRIQSIIREYDIFVRLGGDEFVVLLPGTDPHAAQATIKRIQDQIRAIDLSDLCKKGQKITISASVGIGEYLEGESLEELIIKADQSMYTAKGSSRSR
ncbi:sensor domain-containing diguanylate cyclase [Desulfonatronovibrio hydrogenovorans]|uniref:sensor domain-containing diguanylate cyclase n=1 Tax=Desulfonatronovibrio hydrogenovorans TaxID=53245 RepID=UPI0004914979|nr:sensor domain-containing diguanylate cyclase [Desulfonatronovibrio hydrogenovorans]